MASCLQCFHYILADPPAPLKQVDVWYQIGHALELKRDVSGVVPVSVPG